MTATETVRYPRRRFIRGLLHRMSNLAFHALADVDIVGRENLPAKGPLLVVANHFSYMDPALLVGFMPWRLEFVGGFQMPNAPRIVTFIPRVWGYMPLFRGTGARGALRAAEQVLSQGGVLGIMPEGGSWSQELRPARPGTAFLAVRSGAPILPLGIDGLPELFRAVRRGRRAHVTVRVGEPFGPLTAEGRGPEHRKQVDALGDVIMERIAALLPPERRGWYSDDPEVRAAARANYSYPWATATEA